MKMKKSTPIESETLARYFHNLVNKFYKILPIKESGDDSLGIYLDSFQTELLGCENIVEAIDNDPDYATLIFILQYFIDHPDCEVKKVKREVFRAISICNKLSSKYPMEVKDE